MKAIEISSFGAPEVLRVTERPQPVAGTGDLLIRVAASGVNRPDVLQRMGHYPVPPGASTCRVSKWPAKSWVAMPKP